jgi:hypothetical protein
MAPSVKILCYPNRIEGYDEYLHVTNWKKKKMQQKIKKMEKTT